MKKSFELAIAAICMWMPLAAAGITVVSPNGNETLTLGQPEKFSIAWNAVNIGQAVKIVLLKEDGSKFGLIQGNISAPSPFLWTVGQTASGAAPAGRYKIRVATMDNAYGDVSDGAFTIQSKNPSPIWPRGQKEKMVGIPVTLPAADSTFEYRGDAILTNQELGVDVPIRWTSRSAGPFQIFLHEVGNKSEKLLLTYPASGKAGAQTYETKYRFWKYNSVPGEYKIHVTSPFDGGFSGKFRLKFKLWEMDIVPTILNHYADRQAEGVDRTKWLNEVEKSFPLLPGFARVGFYNQPITGVPAGWWGKRVQPQSIVFRSKITFDLNRFRNWKGKFLMAKLIVVAWKLGIGKCPYGPMDPADCDVRFYVLESPWPGADWFDTGGNHLIQNFPGGTPNDFDIPDWAAAWAGGASPNCGMLLAGGSENMNNDDLYCVNYFQIKLHVMFQEE